MSDGLDLLEGITRKGNGRAAEEQSGDDRYNQPRT